MAWDPCVSCGREFHGGTQFNYVTWFVGEEKFAFRLRHCEECSAQLRTDAMGNGDRRNPKGQWDTSPAQPERKGDRELQVVPNSSHLASRRRKASNGASA